MTHLAFTEDKLLARSHARGCGYTVPALKQPPVLWGCVLHSQPTSNPPASELQGPQYLHSAQYPPVWQFPPHLTPRGDSSYHQARSWSKSKLHPRWLPLRIQDLLLDSRAMASNHGVHSRVCSKKFYQLSSKLKESFVHKLGNYKSPLSNRHFLSSAPIHPFLRFPLENYSLYAQAIGLR